MRTLLYFDIFDHPLTVGEIHRFLPSNSVASASITRAFTAAPLDSLTVRHGPYIAIRDAGGERARRMASERREKERRAHRLLSIARLMARLIGSFPFVRAVFVTGELSKGVAATGADIDYFIVTAPGRLWIARSILIAFKKIFLLNSKRFLCVNHIVSEDGLEEQIRNRYVATEIGTVLPLMSMELHDRYRASNEWVSAYLPNLGTIRTSLAPVSPLLPAPLRSMIEYPLRGSLGERLDRRLMNGWRRIWRRRYPTLTDEQRESLFRCERHISTAYAGDFQPKVQQAYLERLERFHLKPVRLDD